MHIIAHCTSVLFIVLIIFMIMVSLYKKLKLSEPMPRSFECGFNPLMKNRSNFSMRFFIFTILFIIFDVEITLLLPMIPLYRITPMSVWTYISWSLLIIVLIGVFHEWKYNMLEWM